MPPHYDMLAIDIDGTLLDSQGRIPQANIDAIHAARRAGLVVTLCTGRGLIESIFAAEAIEQRDPMVVAGGSIIACPVTHDTLHRYALHQEVVARAADTLLAHRLPVMVLKDPVSAGYDYLMVVGPDKLPLDPVTRWWLESLSVRVRYADHVTDDEHPEHTVRFGACAHAERLEPICEHLVESIGHAAAMHHFPAVVAPQHAREPDPGKTLHVLEGFARDANKWAAIRKLAAEREIPASRIAAIGDQINDLTMIRGAGLGIAMGNAVESVKASAARHTRTNDDAGVAHAIENILTGQW